MWHRCVMILRSLCLRALLLMPSGPWAHQLESNLITFQTSEGVINEVEVSGGVLELASWWTFLKQCLFNSKKRDQTLKPSFKELERLLLWLLWYSAMSYFTLVVWWLTKVSASRSLDLCSEILGGTWDQFQGTAF